MTPFEIDALFDAEGLIPSTWSNGPGTRYAAHQHPYHKVLFCVEGSITFHTGDGDVILMAGDRLDLPPGTRHSATVGPDGVTCTEAATPGVAPGCDGTAGPRP